MCVLANAKEYCHYSFNDARLMYPNPKRNHQLIRIGNIKSRHSSTKKYKVYIDYSDFETNEKFQFLCECFQGNRSCQPCVHIVACFFVILTYQRGQCLSQFESIFAQRVSNAFLDCKKYKDWLKDTNYDGYCLCKKLSYQEIRYFRNLQTKQTRNNNARKRFEKLKNRFVIDDDDNDNNSNENINDNLMDNDNNNNNNNNNSNANESELLDINISSQASQESQDDVEIEIDIKSLIGCKLCCNVWHIHCIGMTEEEADEARENNWRCPFRCNKDVTEVINIEDRMNKLRNVTSNNLFQRIRPRTAREPRKARASSHMQESELKQENSENNHQSNVDGNGKSEISDSEPPDQEQGNMNANHNHIHNNVDVADDSASNHSSDDEVLEGMPTNVGFKVRNNDDENNVSVITGHRNRDINVNHNLPDLQSGSYDVSSVNNRNSQDNGLYVHFDWVTGELHESDVEEEDLSKYFDDMQPPANKKRRTTR